MTFRNCKICNAEFYVKPSHIERGWGKFCSKECQNKGQLSGGLTHCFTCRKQIYRSSAQVRHSKSRRFFCGKSCQTIWRNSGVFIGEAHGNWKGGESVYREILLKADRPKKCERCGIGDLRILSVHHVDKNRKNNRLDNLVWLCFNCHHLIHHDINEYELFMEWYIKCMVPVV